jgi:acyl-CoA thioester hydrolase
MPKVSSSGLDLSDPGVYPCRTAEHVRFSDQDPLGHVNNTSFAVYFETGRLGLNRALALYSLIPGRSIVLVRVEIDYLAELKFPATLSVGAGLLRIGRTSLTYACGLFAGDRCYATSQAVAVTIDRETRRPSPLPEELRAACDPFMLSPSDGSYHE